MRTSRWFKLAAMCAAIVLMFSSAADAAVRGKLEIFSWWAGDEGPALEALISKYEKMYPGATVINSTVTGGSGVNAKAVLKTRMLGGDPPDTFQVHAGQELIGTWVVANRMEDLTWLYEQEGWNKVFPADLLNLLSTDKGIWSVPVNIHRSNVLYFVPGNLAKWGVGVPNTWDEFLEIAPKLKAKGVIPLSVGENWTATHLWESVALSVLGPVKWEQLWNGKLSWRSPEVIRVWELFGEILKYTNTDAPSLSWQQATDMVVKGEAAFNIMGDWASGYMTTTLKLKPGTGFGWAASPGTKGIFMMLSDSFGLPVGCKNKENAIAWLKMLGSRDGQDTFNPLKGSISARTDSDLTKYDAYLQSAARDWRTNKIVGSLAHGVVANERFMNDFATVMDIFLSTKNAQAAANAAQAVAIQAGIGK
ncbi:MAG TPA: carbohydrate ABC transporter substrate-binding protein [Firmicutes bacterium]|jgi:glucose/mannose transport system substrate-binding protein|nr:carbohydrate ABC transporter substrate-binding protein [Bacillota bacterium]